MKHPTLKQYQEYLDYNPKTGKFYWKKTSSNRSVIGTEAGYINKAGYIMIRLCGKIVMAHRIAWLLTHERWPHKYIDHSNNDKADNRIANLREATKGQNSCNRDKQKNNSSGVKGVYWSPLFNKWSAQIGADGKRKTLGWFHKFDDAVECRKKAEKMCA